MVTAGCGCRRPNEEAGRIGLMCIFEDTRKKELSWLRLFCWSVTGHLLCLNFRWQSEKVDGEGGEGGSNVGQRS